ncbi:MAG: hypothetical protein IPI01_18270 [Ignavibacteriae bacterium]|nr:hypothetical protein [Ignavibacteriota bacterium]
MSAVVGRLKMMRVVLAVLLFAESMPLAVAFGEGSGTSIDNVRFEATADLVKIYYDLNAPVDMVHDVRIALRRESDITFTYRPLNITGDVGTIVFPGQKRRVVWEILKEFPDGLQGDDYYFVIEAEYVEPEGSSSWLWIGGGAAVVGGVVLLLVGGKDTPPVIPPVPNVFPQPPARP